MSRIEPSTLAALAFKPTSNPVRYAAGILPAGAFQPYFFTSSRLFAEAKT